MFEKTNLERALTKTRSKYPSLQNTLKGYLEEHVQASSNDTHQLKIPSSMGLTLDINLLDRTRIYHLEHIKKICIDYRLRFLDARLFKAEIPVEAIDRIKQLELIHQTTLNSFKVIAPSKLFKRKDKDDPILFVPLGHDSFYLIYKWGNDLHALRKVMMWPFKNLINLVLTIFVLSFLGSLLIPIDLFSKNSVGHEFWIIFFFEFKIIAAVVLYYGLAKGKNFNNAIWNSRYRYF